MVKRETTEQVVDEWLSANFIGCFEAGEGDYGAMLRWRFVMNDDDAFVRSTLTSDKWGKRAKANKLYRSMLGLPEVKGEIDTDALNGMGVDLMWELNDDGKAVITKLRPNDKLKALTQKQCDELNKVEDARWVEMEAANDPAKEDAPF